MPELPEVEIVRRGLERYVVGRTIASVRVLHPRAVRRHLAGPADFEAVTGGLTVTAARRRGKYLWLPVTPASRPGGTDQDDAILAHLGMSGQLLLADPGRPLTAHVRIVFAFTDGGPELRFTDQRTFGHLAYQPGGAVLPPLIAHIAPDPLEPAFDEPMVISRLLTRRVAVKTALLDQSLVSGIGNIYADEALWRARVHWAQPAARLSRSRAAGIFGAVRDVLRDALAAGGTSFDSLYVNVNGESGYFGRSLAAYGRAGQPCPRCGAPVVRDRFSNRSAYTCPRCQRRPRIRTTGADLRSHST